MATPIYVDIVSPDGSVFKGNAVGVKAPGVEGSFEVLSGHAPMIAAFEIGSLVITLKDGEHLTFATSGGFLEVLNNTVTVLAETAEAANEIDVERAKEAEQHARQLLDEASSAEDKAKAASELEKARNRLRSAISSV